MKKDDINLEKVSEAISALPMCKDGKNAVKTLLKTMGYEIEKESKVKPGSFIRTNISVLDNNYIFVCKNGDLIWTNDGGKSCHDLSYFQSSPSYKLYSSLKELQENP